MSENDLFMGYFLDGDVAVPDIASVDFDDAGQTLIILSEGGKRARWPYGELRALRDQAGKDQMVLRQAGDATARLVVSDIDALKAIRRRAPKLNRAPPVKGRGRLAAWALGAVASVALIILVLVPIMADQLAEYLPPEGEKALGEVTLNQIRNALDETGFGELPFCENPKGLAALAKIQSALEANADLPVDITVHVLDHPMINAFALPGGTIVFFNGLLQASESQTEVAAVFAHEMGHVEARDPTRIALRSAGSIGVLGLLFGDFAGGTVVLFLTERLIQADYTREAEAGADVFAHDLLLRTGLPPSGIATFFERLQGENGDEAGLVQHFASHPALGNRIEAAWAATPEDFEMERLLNKDQWAALQGICN